MRGGSSECGWGTENTLPARGRVEVDPKLTRFGGSMAWNFLDRPDRAFFVDLGLLDRLGEFRQVGFWHCRSPSFSAEVLYTLRAGQISRACVSVGVNSGSQEQCVSRLKLPLPSPGCGWTVPCSPSRVVNGLAQSLARL